MIPKEEEETFTINLNSFPKSTPGSNNPPQLTSNYYGLIWFKNSRGSYSIDFTDYPIEVNSIIIISKNQNVHFNFSAGSNDFIFITFAQNFIESSNEEVQKFLSFCMREHFEGKQILRIEKEDEKNLSHLTNQLYEIANAWTGDLKKNSLFHYLQLLLIYCTHLSRKQDPNLVKGYTEVVGKFTSLLENNFRSTQKVNFYSENLNLTYNSLARYTTNYCNKTPKEIIVERLILEIKRLLAGSNAPIKEIAFNLGFDEPTNLVKYFKKYTGVTPSEFRKKK